MTRLAGFLCLLQVDGEGAYKEQNQDQQSDADQDGTDDAQNPPSVGGAPILRWTAAGIDGFQLVLPHDPGDWCEEPTNDQSEDAQYENRRGLTGFWVLAGVGRELLVGHRS